MPSFLEKAYIIASMAPIRIHRPDVKVNKLNSSAVITFFGELRKSHIGG